MQNFSYLLNKILYIFRTGSLSIIRSISALYKRNRHLSCQFCWLSLADRVSDSQQNQLDKYLLRLYSVEILLMMDSGHVRKIQSILSSKFEKICISLAFIIRTMPLYLRVSSRGAHITKFSLMQSYVTAWRSVFISLHN